MAVIHDTTMSPGKLDLLSSWLPVQPWYAVTVVDTTVAVSDRSGTELRIRSAGPDGSSDGQLLVRVCRVLRPAVGPATDDGAVPDGAVGRPGVSATWRLPNGTQVRGTLITAR